MEETWREHTNSAFDHTCDVIDRCKQKGYSFETFIACVAHDFGKATTPEDVLPSHYGHEFRSVGIAKEWLAKHRFSAKTNALVPVAAEHHMKAHNLTILRPTSLIRWYKSIKNHIPDVVHVFDCDHELTEEQRVILTRLEETFKTAKIEISPELKKKGREAIKNFVEQIYVKRYKELLK